MTVSEEIEKIRGLISKWNLTYPDKRKASSLALEITYFKRDFNHNFKTLKLSAESSDDFNEAIEYLNDYSKSQLKQKDDIYFRKGITLALDGLKHILSLHDFSSIKN